MLKYVIRFLMVLCVLMTFALVNNEVVQAKQWFSASDEEQQFYFRQLCRDGMELIVFNLPPGSGYETHVDIREYTGPLGAAHLLSTDFDAMPKLSGGDVVVKDHGENKLTIDYDGDGLASELQIYGTKIFMWPRQLAVNTPIAIDELVENHTVLTQDLPVVEDCYFHKTAFSYQGRLSDVNGVANGLFDLRFTLYAREQTLDSMVSRPVEMTGVTITNGLFMTELDFGDAFDGTPRWLAIEVRPTGTASYTTLQPRQPLNPVPYTSFAYKGYDYENEFYEKGLQIVGAMADGITVRGSLGNGILVQSYNEDAAILAQSSGSGNGINVQTQDGTGLSVTNQADKPTIYAENGSLGNGLEISAIRGNSVYATNWSTNATIYAQNRGAGPGFEITAASGNGATVVNNAVYATVYAENSGTGNGVAAQVGNANAINAHNAATYATVYGENSGAGTGGAFTSYNGTNILVAQEEVTEGSFNTRFRVALNGDVYADGRFVPGGADFAEMLPAAPGLEAGDVLIIDAQGILNRSTTPNAPNVAGVYSTKPGIIGGLHQEEDGAAVAAANNHNAVPTGDLQGSNQATDTTTAPVVSAVVPTVKTLQPDPLVQAYAQQAKVPLALVGIVPVKVSTENGAIQPGDLLTTSALPGHAMKATPIDLGGILLYRPGTIIGKALEPLGTGTGVIRVLVTLQ